MLLFMVLNKLIWYADSNNFTAKKTKGPEVVLIAIPIVSMVGEDTLNHSPPRPELSNISWILLSYFIFFPGKAVWLCPDMKTYPSVFEMIPKETVSRHKSTKIREPWHIIVIDGSRTRRRICSHFRSFQFSRFLPQNFEFQDSSGKILKPAKFGISRFCRKNLEN